MRESAELMVFSSKNITEKTHLLNPCFTNSTEEEAMLPLQTCSESSPPDLKLVSLSVSFHGWRLSNKNFKSWAIKMAALHKPIWQKAGIFEAVMSSTRRIRRNTDLVLGIAERWCPDTNTFVFPWGEATLTLEDVMILLGFSVLGLPYSTPLDTSEEEKVKEKLEKEWRKIQKDKAMFFVTKVAWMGRFMDSDDDELEHVAFLALWLSYFVFPSSNYNLHKDVFSLAVHLSKGTRIALAPTVLANLYQDLTLLRNHIRGFTVAKMTEKIELTSLFKLVQVWTWERFKELQPKPNLMLEGEPRMARWEDSKHQRTNHVREIFVNSKMESFEWRPYTRTVINWKFPKFYPEEEVSVSVDPDLDDEFVSFARCVKVCELVGTDSVQCYYPNRVVSQFGLLQDVPCHVKPNKNPSKEVAWDEYSKAICVLTLFIPSRSATPRFTPAYREWWSKTSPVESAQSLTQRNITGGDDDTSNSVVPTGSKRQNRIHENDENDDESLTIAETMRLKKKRYCNGRDALEQVASDESNSRDVPKVVPLSQVLQKLGEGFPKELKRYRRRCRVKEAELKKCKMGDIGVEASREVPLSELFHKDIVKRNKRARAYDDESCQKLTSEDETVGEREIEQMSEEVDDEGKEEEETGSKAEEITSLNPPLVSNGQSPRETVERCDDVADINVEKKVDDGTKGEECFLQEEEDGEKKRSSKKECVDDAGKEEEEEEITSLNPPLVCNGGVVENGQSPRETVEICDDEADINVEKKFDDGAKEAERFVDDEEDGVVKERSSHKEYIKEYAERLKQRRLVTEELALDLEASLVKMEKTLAMIRISRTKKPKSGVSA